MLLHDSVNGHLILTKLRSGLEQMSAYGMVAFSCGSHKDAKSAPFRTRKATV